MRILIHDYAGHPFGFELSRELAARGHEVRHAYFGGDEGPKGAVSLTADDPPSLSITPITIKSVYAKGALIKRHFLDRAYGHAAAAAIRSFRPDVILNANTPANALAPIQSAARACDARFVLWLQDVFGLAAQALIGSKWLGAGRLVAAYYTALERRAFARSDRIVAISEDFLPYLNACGVPNDRTSVIPNWGPISDISPRSKDNAWSRAHGLVDKTVFAYTGTLGMKHDPTLLYNLAASFKDRPDIAVVVASFGVGADWLRQQNTTQPLPNLHLSGPIPFSDLADAYGASDVLVALLEPDAGIFSVPSKVLAYLCTGRPILLSAPPSNNAVRTIMGANGGVATPAGDAEAFISAAHGLAADPDRRSKLGACGRAHAEANFPIQAVADSFEPILTRWTKSLSS